MDDMKQCPYCGENIRAEAIRCRYCRSRLATFDPAHWYRSHPEARLAGVCAALAHVLAVPVTAVRLGFGVLTFFHLAGPLLYAALWLIIPGRPEEDSLLERGLRAALDLAATLGGRHNRPPGPPDIIEHSS